MLKIVRTHEDGNPFLVNIIVPDEMIPHHSLISPMPYHGTAVALVTCEVDQVSPQQWYGELKHNSEKSREVALLPPEQAAYDAAADRPINASHACR